MVGSGLVAREDAHLRMDLPLRRRLAALQSLKHGFWVYGLRFKVYLGFKSIRTSRPCVSPPEHTGTISLERPSHKTTPPQTLSIWKHGRESEAGGKRHKIHKLILSRV